MASEGPPGGLGGLKLDEIDATNSFLMLLMARNGLKWPFKGHLRPVKNHVDHHIFQLITAFHLFQ